MRIRILSIFLLFFFIITPSNIYAQDRKEYKGIVQDESTGEALAFASIYSNNKMGTTSNQDGLFGIVANANDSLFISYVGYYNQVVALEDSSLFITVNLKPRITKIQTVEVEAQNDFLYRLIANCRFSMAQQIDTSRAYYNLTTKVNHVTTEKIEAYYNACTQGYDLKELILKNGRIGIQEYKEQYFISLRTSNAILRHKTLSRIDYFPENPLGMTKGKLKRNFNLKFIARYRDNEGRRIYEISFTPLEKNNRSFSGTVWVDSTNQAFIKVEMSLLNAASHPFLPLFSDGKIESVDLFLRKEFERKEKWYYLKSADFQYALIYKNRNKEKQIVNTSVLFYVFDNSPFFSPLFDFPINLSDDYRKINALPNQKTFWQHPERFKLVDKNGETEEFFTSPNTIRAKEAFSNRQLKRNNFFEHPYSIWNGQRIRMRNEPIAFYDKQHEQPNKTLRGEKYAFQVQLFLDVNQWKDSIQYCTAAIFDPYRSYYHFVHDSVSTLILNLYFDLAGVYKRELDKTLSKLVNKSEILQKYELINKAYKAEAKTFLKEINFGRNRSALRKWNDELQSKTGIDNIEIFWKE